MCTQSPSRTCPPRLFYSTGTQRQGIPPRPRSLLGLDILKQGPGHSIPDASPLARIIYLLWSQDSCVNPTQPLLALCSLTCTKGNRKPFRDDRGWFSKTEGYLQHEEVFKSPPILQALIRTCLQNSCQRRSKKRKTRHVPRTSVLAR